MEISFKQTLFSIDPKNKRCNDCGDKNVKYVSVNNGVTICELCAEIHKKKINNNQISYVRNIDDDYDDYLMNYFIYGGNKNFRHTLKKMGINFDMQKSNLYKTYAADYYRQCLKSKVKGDKPPPNLPENPSEIIPVISTIFPEFENYVVNNKLNEDIHNENNIDDEDDTHFKKEENNKQDIHENKDLNENNNNKINELNENNNSENKNNDKKGLMRNSLIKMKKIGGVVKTNGIKGFVVMKKAGIIFVQKTKPVANKIASTAKYVGKTTYKYVGSHMPHFHKNRTSIDNKEDNNEKNNEDEKNHENKQKEDEKEDDKQDKNNNQIEFK